jgi:hypothetical protein
MTVVLCSEMFGTPWPPGQSPLPQLQLPAQRGAANKTICENAP